jgi:3-methyladenine DNA glycosylase AlkD
MENIIGQIRLDLKQSIDLATLKSGERFFKEKIKLYGVKTAIVSQIAKNYFPSDLSKKEIFDLCEEMLKSDYMEEAFIAFDWSEKLHKQFVPEDFAIFEHWVKDYINNWAKCDTLCNHTIGDFLIMFPEFIEKLKSWAKSDNRWIRRAAAVTLIIPARKGMFLKDIFEIADTLLLDKDDLVQKGYGWMLKAASQANELEVFNYIMNNKAKMPRTALRYAIEKMPEDLRKQAMAK